MTRIDADGLVVELVAEASDTEFGQNRAARPAAKVVVRGRQAHRRTDPEKEALKRRLKDAISTMRRLAAEKDSGADMRAALSRLETKTFAAQLAKLAGMAGGRSKAVSAADLDRLEETLGWLASYVVDVEVQRLVLDWARGERWDAMIVVYGASQATLWRRIDAALNDMLCELRAKLTTRLNR